MIRFNFPKALFMKPTIHLTGLRIPGAATGAVTLLTGLLFFLTVLHLAGQDAPLPELQTAEQVRRLTPEQAARHYPVRLRGVLTFFDQVQFYRFFQDDTAGVYLFPSDALTNAALATGELVEIEGQTSPGEYAPTVTPQQTKILGAGTFPPAKPVSYEDLASGGEDSQFVEIHGLVRAVSFDAQTKYYSIEIATGGGRLTALATQLPVRREEDLEESTVKIRGVCVSRFNLQRQLFDLRLLVPRPTDMVIETPAPSHPFDAPTRPIAQLLQFTPRGAYGYRVKVSGTVIYRRDDALYIEDKTEGLYVETRQTNSLLPGDQVEVSGFPAKGEYIPMLQDAIFRKTGSGPLLAPDPVTADEALKGTHDCRLVRIEATVLDRTRYSREQFLVLQSGGFIFSAYLERKNVGVNFVYLQNGCKVAVTGVCLIERGNDWHVGPDWRAKSFRILLRSAGDIFVLQGPPWWNLQKLLWMVGILCVVVLVVLMWVGVLRRRVQKQTQIIRQQLQTEAALKERYEDLFENANDMVFTHDMSGNITSINKTGEQILGRPRDAILSKNLIEFVVEEQRAAAAQWLAQVAKSAELPPAEWDCLNSAGQRIRLEISTRVVGRAGKQMEVEGIARDITERKRLEREILEISSREQRRIGHDLHDGVCQQLAAIAYRMDILAEQLQEKGVAESSEAERVGGLVNEAINQTRGVARGLFPISLEENGLVSALEELAVNTSNLFKVQCQFSAEGPLPQAENGVALHLYYIAQEAVLNAAKHSRAGNISISLTRANDRFILAIHDDGSGFELSDHGFRGMGIRIMRYRARVIGATLDLKSQPGQGTQISCVFYATA
jgi:PAS domain S-box-containing protein